MRIEQIKSLLVKIAWVNCDPRMSGPDGNMFGFCSEGYPEDGSIGAFEPTEEEAAFAFLMEIFS